MKNDLDQLTVIVNNKYAGGHHVFDYELKLIQLSPEQIAAEKMAIKKAEELQKKH